MKKLVAFLMIMCLLIPFINRPVEVKAYELAGNIFICDERMKGMETYIVNKGGFYVYIDNDVASVLDKAKMDITDIINSNSSYTDWNIILCFGYDDVPSTSIADGSNPALKTRYYNIIKGKLLVNRLPQGKTYSTYICPVFRTNHSSGDSSRPNKDFISFNNFLKQLASDKDSVYFISSLLDYNIQSKDNNSPLVDFGLQLKGNYGSDNIHFTNKGYELITNKIYQVVTNLEFHSYNSVQELSTEELQQILSDINTSMDRSAEYGTLVSIYSALKTSGFSDYECAAILVNMNRECSMRPDTINSIGAVGLIQWLSGRRDNLVTFSANLGDSTYDLNGYVIGGIGTQVAFLMQEFNDGNQWLGYAPSYYSINVEEASSYVNSSSINLTQKITQSEWRNMTNVVAMSMYFTSQFERCEKEVDIFNLGAKQAPDMFKVITRCDPASASDPSVNQQLVDALVNAGIWGEDEFVSFSQLVEYPLSMPTRDDLSKEQLEGVVDWKNNIDSQKDNFIIRAIRVAVVFLGICFIVWVVLLYLSYWLDRVNNFIDIEFLPIVSLGRLKISPDESDCTFSPKNFNKGDVQTVNKKVITTICFLGLFFAVFILSGTMYTVLNFFVRKMLGWLGI